MRTCLILTRLEAERHTDRALDRGVLTVFAVKLQWRCRKERRLGHESRRLSPVRLSRMEQSGWHR